MKTYNLAKIMKKAWEIKKTSILKFGKSKAKDFASCLRSAWKIAKEGMLGAKKTTIKTTVYTYIIPDWIMYEKELFGIRCPKVKKEDFEEETKKAFKIYGEWIPKSVCNIITDVVETEEYI